MDFDEYEYLEKTVEDPDSPMDNDRKSRDGSDRSYRKRDGDRSIDGAEDDEDRNSKRSRGGDDDRSSRDRDRHRRDRDSEKDKPRDRERSHRDKDKNKEKEKEKERDREKEREKRRERDRELERERDRERERERRSRSSSRKGESDRELIRERERELELRESRLLMKDMSSIEKKREDDADVHLARNIMQNKQYSMSGRADGEYDYEDGPCRKSRKKRGGDDHKISQRSSLATRVLTQQERCLFCFENPNRPKHLVVSIANFTYLMLPQWQSVVPGHCCILTTQHESSTRTVDNNVWDEIRNFKKCLIMMFAKQEKELVFLETVMGLAQQRRHCMVECIPLPQDIAKEAPLYFKKAIDEAEDEWSQHNAKRLIDTSVKGLRRSIPKDFPYFHVEFGLSKGFVHVIDDEKQFKSNMGLNVIRGMLQLAEEDMYRRRRHKSVETQKQAVLSFAREWEPFDWTKHLD